MSALAELIEQNNAEQLPSPKHTDSQEWYHKRAKECVTRLHSWTEELAKVIPNVATSATSDQHLIMLNMIHAYFGLLVTNDDIETANYREKVKDVGDTFMLNKHLTLTVFEELALEKKENISLRRIVRTMARESVNDDFGSEPEIATLKDSLDTMVQLNDRMKAQQIKMSADIYALLQQQKILDQHIENAEQKLQKMATDNSRYKHMVDHLKVKRNINTPSLSPPRTRESVNKSKDAPLEVLPRPPSTSNGMGAWGRTHKPLSVSRSKSSVGRQRGNTDDVLTPGGLFVNGHVKRKS
jgi:hypothetical protein